MEDFFIIKKINENLSTESMADKRRFDEKSEAEYYFITNQKEFNKGYYIIIPILEKK